jgi:hypothetical protein
MDDVKQGVFVGIIAIPQPDGPQKAAASRLRFVYQCDRQCRCR